MRTMSAGESCIYKDGQPCWSTRMEIEFINRLGEYRPYARVAGRSTRKVLLQRYLDAARRRENWGNVDRDKILRHVESLIVGENIQHLKGLIVGAGRKRRHADIRF